MALTPAQICTLALLRAGEKQPVDDLEGESFEEQVSALLYEHARDCVLEERDWPFATRRATLGLLADDSADAEARTGWGYVYAMPTDLLQPRYIELGLRNPAPEQMADFAWEDDADHATGVLLCDVADAELVYTRRVTETGKFTPLFTDALIWRLAYEMTLAIPVLKQAGLAMMSGYEMALNKAAASSFRHQKSGPPARPAAIRARTGSVRVGRSGEE